MAENQNKNLTRAGTDIEEVKRKNADSGMSYNEAKAYIAKTTGGQGTDFLSNTNPEEVKESINKSTNKNNR